MKPVPLYVVKYFKGDETRTLSKHLHSESAFQVGSRFISNLKDKINQDAQEPVIIAITKIDDSEGHQTILSITNRANGPTGEGVSITLESQTDPNWDYPQHDDPRKSGSGQRTTVTEHQKWPFTIIPQ